MNVEHLDLNWLCDRMQAYSRARRFGENGVGLVSRALASGGKAANGIVTLADAKVLLEALADRVSEDALELMFQLKVVELLLGEPGAAAALEKQFPDYLPPQHDRPEMRIVARNDKFAMSTSP